MTPRFQLAIAILVFSAFAVGCAQTKPSVPKAQAKEAPAKAAKLPPIVPNPKWTLSQNSAQLLLDTQVQRDMELPQESKTAILKVYSEYNAKYTELTKGAVNDSLEAALDAATLDASTKAVAILSPDQLSRLDQLGIQAMELEALRLADVRAKLALTADQTSHFDKVFSDLDAKQLTFDSALGERMSKLNDPGPTATEEQQTAFKKQEKGILDDMEPQAKGLAELRKSDMENLIAALTPEQKAAWQTMVGLPLKG